MDYRGLPLSQQAEEVGEMGGMRALAGGLGWRQASFSPSFLLCVRVTAQSTRREGDSKPLSGNTTRQPTHTAHQPISHIPLSRGGQQGLAQGIEGTAVHKTFVHRKPQRALCL